MRYYSEFYINMIGSKTVSRGPNVSTVDKKTEFLSYGKTDFLSNGKTDFLSAF